MSLIPDIYSLSNWEIADPNSDQTKHPCGDLLRASTSISLLKSSGRMAADASSIMSRAMLRAVLFLYTLDGAMKMLQMLG